MSSLAAGTVGPSGFDPAGFGRAGAARERLLLRGMVVAGVVAAASLSPVALVGPLPLHDLPAGGGGVLPPVLSVVAAVALAYAAWPLMKGAWSALSARRLDPDVPLALAVLLTTGAGLGGLPHGAAPVDFAGPASLLFFLLAGRYFDSRACRRAAANCGTSTETLEAGGALLPHAYSASTLLLAAAVFTGWLVAGTAWQQAAMLVVAVLVVTCSCAQALALAVPALQETARDRLRHRGILSRFAAAPSRVAKADVVVFGKAGALTLGAPVLLDDGNIGDEALEAAAAMAATGRHPLARALAAAVPGIMPATGVQEEPGHGLRRATPEGEIRLGSRRWCGVVSAAPAAGPELWFCRPGFGPMLFRFEEALRPDAAAVVAALRRDGVDVELLSGDRPETVAAAARAVGLKEWRAEMQPSDKAARLESLAAEGRRVCLVSDGRNHASVLSAAFVSMSPAGAGEAGHAAADLVFRGQQLSAVLEVRQTARATRRLLRRHLALGGLYAGVAVPLACAGVIPPLLAAVAVALSSLVRCRNALWSQSASLDRPGVVQ